MLANVYQAFRASWKPGHLVLRPNLLSVYKDEEATRLKLSITLSEVTAVAPFKSPRSKRDHLFAIYCASKNYRFQAASQKDAEDWIQRIRSETRLDEEEAALLALSQKDQAESTAAKGGPIEDAADLSETDPAGRPSSPELGASLSPNTQSKGYAYPPDYSANDMTSEWSDGPSTGPIPNLRPKRSANNLSSAPGAKDGQASLPRENSRNADLGVLRDPERVICNGYLQCLRTKGGVRQWKRYWVVLRPKSLGFYKDDQVSTTSIVLPLKGEKKLTICTGIPRRQGDPHVASHRRSGRGSVHELEKTQKPLSAGDRGRKGVSPVHARRGVACQVVRWTQKHHYCSQEIGTSAWSCCLILITNIAYLTLLA